MTFAPLTKRRQDKPARSTGPIASTSLVSKGQSALTKFGEQLAASHGEPVPHGVAQHLGRTLGEPLVGAVVHKDAVAATAAQAINARAFTYGNHIFLGKGAYSPASATGHKLLAHEAAHVLQYQRGEIPVDSSDDDCGVVGLRATERRTGLGSEDKAPHRIERGGSLDSAVVVVADQQDEGVTYNPGHGWGSWYWNHHGALAGRGNGFGSTGGWQPQWCG
jgi:hypothetical protein